mmetsp:Transcript_15050/g.32320  ORF Transcript_15050/g.32320 Transcript_15050/m.32320 type:complete len:312 (-) Transcript_15050:894-1829(-)
MGACRHKYAISVLWVVPLPEQKDERQGRDGPGRHYDEQHGVREGRGVVKCGALFGLRGSALLTARSVHVVAERFCQHSDHQRGERRQADLQRTIKREDGRPQLLRHYVAENGCIDRATPRADEGPGKEEGSVQGGGGGGGVVGEHVQHDDGEGNARAAANDGRLQQPPVPVRLVPLIRHVAAQESAEHPAHAEGHVEVGGGGGREAHVLVPQSEKRQHLPWHRAEHALHDDAHKRGHRQHILDVAPHGGQHAHQVPLLLEVRAEPEGVPRQGQHQPPHHRAQPTHPEEHAAPAQHEPSKRAAGGVDIFSLT